MKLLVALFSALLLSACGGGSSGGSSTVSPPSVTTLSVSGTAATGKSIPGATVNIKCSSGSGSTSTLADGTYSLAINGGNLPCILQVANPIDLSKLHSIASGTGSNVIANLTPLTDMVTARVLRQDPAVYFATLSNTGISANITEAGITSAQSDVRTVLAGIVDLAAISQILSTPLVASTNANSTGGDAQDKILDAMNAKLSSSQIGQVVTALANTASISSVKDIVTNIVAIPPSTNAGPDQSVATGSLVTLDGSASTAEPGRVLTFTWNLTSKPTGSNANLSQSTSVNPTFTPDVAGTYTASLVVSDGRVNGGTDAINIVANVANSPPVAIAGVTQNVVAGTLVTLDGSLSSDANSDTLTYAWTITSKPAGSLAALSASNASKPTFTADLGGSYVASLRVNDGKVDSGNTATVSVVASVANSAPIAAAGLSQRVIEGTLVVLDGGGSSDANNDLLTYAWTLSSKPLDSVAKLESSTTSKPTFTADKSGSYVVTLAVSDGKATSSNLSTVTVTAVPSSVANVGFSRNVLTRTNVSLNGTLSTSEGNKPLTYTWTIASKPQGSSPNLKLATTSRPVFVADRPGIYSVSLIVNDGVRDSAPSLLRIAATAGRISSVDHRTLAIKSDGTVLGWGINLNGELGDGTQTQRLAPTKVANLTGVIAISAGMFHSVALKDDGTVWTWGYGALGNGVEGQSLWPQMVLGLNNVVSISAGNAMTMALKSDGTVVAWGSNYMGKLGDGTQVDRFRPVPVLGLTNVVSIAAGITYSVALKSDGTVYTWGDNSYGQLGDGSTFSRSTPAIVPGLFGVVDISASNQTAAVRSDGTVAMWGDNSNGQLGDGTTYSRRTPTNVIGITGATSISTNKYHTVAVRADGSVMAWGVWIGLGDGSGQNQYSPVVTQRLSDVAQVCTGDQFSTALSSDGTIWIWGMNTSGQFGDGSINNYRTSPAPNGLAL